MTDAGKYRSVAEAELWKKRDPIPRLAKSMLEAGIVDQERLDQIAEKANATVIDAMMYAEESPVPDASSLYDDVYVENHGA